jgi:hypothetical protein
MVDLHFRLRRIALAIELSRTLSLNKPARGNPALLSKPQNSAGAIDSPAKDDGACADSSEEIEGRANCNDRNPFLRCTLMATRPGSHHRPEPHHDQGRIPVEVAYDPVGERPRVDHLPEPACRWPFRVSSYCARYHFECRDPQAIPWSVSLPVRSCRSLPISKVDPQASATTNVSLG